MKRLLSLLTALVLTVSVFAASSALPASAATYRSASNSASSSYKGGKFYGNFQKVELTGDNRTDVIALALSQVGYLEGDSNGAFSGTVAGSKNYTEYNYNMGDWGSGYTYEWCATFVSWCLYQSGSTDQNSIRDWCRSHTTEKAYIWREVGCARWADQLRNFGYFKYSKHNGGTYAPQTGDLIFYDWAGGKSGEDHIGLVVYSDGSNVYTVEGNTSDQAGLVSAGGGVFFKKYSLSYDKITGYGVLPYKVNSSAPKIDYSGAKRTKGYYVNPDDSKTLYTSETGSDSVREMPRFTMFEVTQICQNGRLKVKYSVNGVNYEGYLVENSANRLIQITSFETDGLSEALESAESLNVREYSEEVLALIRAKYEEGVKLYASSSATTAQKKSCADELNALIARRGEGETVTDAVTVTAINAKVTTGDAVIFTPSFGTVTGDKANHKYTVNIVAAWDAGKNAYVVKSNTSGSGADTPDIALASDEMLLAVHYDAGHPESAVNDRYAKTVKAGDLLVLHGIDVAAGKAGAAPYVEIVRVSSDKPDPILGDVNDDGLVDNSDAAAILRYDAHITNFIENADVNGDGTVDNSDAAFILRIDAGLQ